MCSREDRRGIYLSAELQQDMLAWAGSKQVVMGNESFTLMTASGGRHNDGPHLQMCKLGLRVVKGPGATWDHPE